MLRHKSPPEKYRMLASLILMCDFIAAGVLYTMRDMYTTIDTEWIAWMLTGLLFLSGLTVFIIFHALARKHEQVQKKDDTTD